MTTKSLSLESLRREFVIAQQNHPDHLGGYLAALEEAFYRAAEQEDINERSQETA